MDFVVAPVALVKIRLFVGYVFVFSAKIRNPIRLLHLVSFASLYLVTNRWCYETMKLRWDSSFVEELKSESSNVDPCVFAAGIEKEENYEAHGTTACRF